MKGKGHGMQIQIHEGVRIENPREYGCQTVEQLRNLMATGSSAQPDPRREHFYEIEGDSESYYVFISPISGNIVLLAKWLRQAHDSCTNVGHLVA
jgi:hypothetical protein